MSKKRSNYFIFIIVFCVGITLGKLLNWGYFVLDREVSIIDALILFATIGIGLYISNVIEREVQKDRTEKDLFLLKILEIESHLMILENLIENNDIPYYKLENQIHQCGVKKNLLYENLAKTKINISTTEGKGIKLNLSRYIRDFRRSISTPITPSLEREVVVTDGVVRLSSSRITQLISISNQIKNELFKLKIMINLS